MKSVAHNIQELQDELQDRMNWILVACTLMEFAVKNGMTDELKRNMEFHVEKGQMK